jgi:predicted regulator of Ras-like GTPase activity (Roadblock/LC7/MglB family)
LLKQNNFILLTIFLIKKQNITQIHMEMEQNEDTRTPNLVEYVFQV